MPLPLLQGELRPTHVTGAAWAARIGRTADVQWLPLPSPVGEHLRGCLTATQGKGGGETACQRAVAGAIAAAPLGMPVCVPATLPPCCSDLPWPHLPAPAGAGTVLAASLEDGTLALFDTVHTMEVRPRRTRMLRYQAMLHAAAPSEAGASQPHAWGLLAGPPPVAAPPLLPRAWGLLLRLLLQRGLPEAVFRELGALAAALAGSATQASSRTLQAEQALERLEGEVRRLGVAWVLDELVLGLA